jgi:hypothetical protein
MTQKETFSEMSVRLYQTTLSESEDNSSLLFRVRELAHETLLFSVGAS